MRNIIVSTLAFAMLIACILWNIDAPTRLGYAILTEQYLAFQLGIAIAIAFLLFDAKGGKKARISWSVGEQ